MRQAPFALVVSALLLVGCGAMSEYEEPQVPQQPQTAAAQVGVTSSDEVAAQRAADQAKADAQARVDEFNDTDPSALTEFKPTLDPYGSWVEDPTYGTVWVPSSNAVGPDFAPYVTNGHWALDENDQYLWVSDYDQQFGWVTFHYGRWVYVDGRGWSWIPGRRYAPAWVVWRAGEPGYDYVGWAPAPPYYYWGYGGGVVWMSYYPPAPYVFCGSRYVFANHVNTYIVDRGHVAAVAAHTAPYGSSGGGGHVLANPQRGPSVASGHIPASAWPSTHSTADMSHARYSSPSAMGRPGAAMPTAGSRTAGVGPSQGGSHSLGVTRSPSSPSHALVQPSRSYSGGAYSGGARYAPSPYGGGSHSIGSSYAPSGHSYTPYGHSYAPSGGGGTPAPVTSTPSKSRSSAPPAPARSSGFRGGGRRR